MDFCTFSHSDSREALRQARAALGEDLVVIANRLVDGVFELSAIAYRDLAAKATPVDVSHN